MADVAHIVGSSLGIPEHSALHIVHLLVQTVLGWQLVAAWIHRVGILGGALDVLADIERSVARIFVPPLDKGLVIGSLVAYLPINLRHAVVNEAIVHPEEHIGIEVVVVLQSEGVGTDWGVAPVAIDAER